jgi:polyisoprenoid-binding protein YceI
VLVFREGLLSAVAHDLFVRVTALEIAVDLGPPAVTARLDASSLRVVSAMRDGRALPDALAPADVRKIEATIASEILRAPRFPEIHFASTEVRPTPGGYEVRGALTLGGATRPLVLSVRREGGGLATETTIHQPDFGIVPYRAMLGTLRVKPDVVVRAFAPAP